MGMNLIQYKELAAAVIFIISLVGIIYPLKVRARATHNNFLELADAVASGIFLGAALFHMLPNAISGFADVLGHIHYPLAELCCAGGFLLLVFFERLSGNSPEHQDTVPYVIAIIIILHSLIEGAVLGINTAFSTASIIFLAIVAHKTSESFALAIILNRTRISFRHLLILVLLFSFMTPLGIALGTSMSLYLQSQMGQLTTAAFNAFAAGTFLYMSTLHHVNHHARTHEGEGLLEFFALVSGLAIMAVIPVFS
jgi:zinc transporter 1/2/3